MIESGPSRAAFRARVTRATVAWQTGAVGLPALNENR
jgi:hypothetical protein